MPPTAWPSAMTQEQLHAEWRRQQQERQAEQDEGRTSIRHKLECIDIEIYGLQKIRWEESRAALARLGIDPERLPPPIKVHPAEYTRTQRTPRTLTTAAAPPAGILYRPTGRVLKVR
jgi:hypothetical protein